MTENTQSRPSNDDPIVELRHRIWSLCAQMTNYLNTGYKNIFEGYADPLFQLPDIVEPDKIDYQVLQDGIDKYDKLKQYMIVMQDYLNSAKNNLPAFIDAVNKIGK